MENNSFDEKPKISVNPENKVKPFTLRNNIVYLSNKYDGKEYRIRISKGYNWDGATIPRFFYRIIGSQYNPDFLPASLIHDFCCENKAIFEEDGVKISSDIFRDILILYNVPKWKAKLMAGAVRFWQTFQDGWN